MVIRTSRAPSINSSTSNESDPSVYLPKSDVMSDLAHMVTLLNTMLHGGSLVTSDTIRDLNIAAREMYQNLFAAKFDETREIPLPITEGMHVKIVDALALWKPILEDVRVKSKETYDQFVAAMMADINVSHKDIFGYYPGHGKQVNKLYSSIDEWTIRCETECD